MNKFLKHIILLLIFTLSGCNKISSTFQESIDVVTTATNETNQTTEVSTTEIPEKTTEEETVDESESSTEEQLIDNDTLYGEFISNCFIKGLFSWRLTSWEGAVIPQELLETEDAIIGEMAYGDINLDGRKELLLAIGPVEMDLYVCAIDSDEKIIVTYCGYADNQSDMPAYTRYLNAKTGEDIIKTSCTIGSGNGTLYVENIISKDLEVVELVRYFTEYDDAAEGFRPANHEFMGEPVSAEEYQQKYTEYVNELEVIEDIYYYSFYQNENPISVFNAILNGDAPKKIYPDVSVEEKNIQSEEEALEYLKTYLKDTGAYMPDHIWYQEEDSGEGYLYQGFDSMETHNSTAFWYRVYPDGRIFDELFSEYIN